MNGMEGRPVELAYDRDSGVSDRLLWSRLSKATNRDDFVAAWLPLQARLLRGAQVGVLILGEAEKGPFMPAGVYPPRAAVSPDLSIAAETALDERKGVVRDQPAGERNAASQCVALPIIIDDELHGVVAFELEPRGTEALSEAGRRLQWGIAWIEVLVRRKALLPNAQLIAVLDIAASVMEAPQLSVALQTLVVEMAQVLRVEWVACGLVRHGTHVSVEALSQSVTTSRKQQVVAATTSAMQEAFDQRGLI